MAKLNRRVKKSLYRSSKARWFPAVISCCNCVSWLVSIFIGNLPVYHLRQVKLSYYLQARHFFLLAIFLPAPGPYTIDRSTLLAGQMKMRITNRLFKPLD